MTFTKVDYDVAVEVASHEALVRQAYKDSVGVLTWCVGMTNATGHKVERYVHNPADLQHCMNIYVWALSNYADGVREAFSGHDLTKAQFAAALSFHWNTGAIKRALWVERFKKGDDLDTIGELFLNWRSPPEILERRKKEAELFVKGKWSNKGTILEYTKVRSNLVPVWSSAVHTNVEEALSKAFDAPGSSVEIDDIPDSEGGSEAHTLSPEGFSSVWVLLGTISKFFADFLKGHR